MVTKRIEVEEAETQLQELVHLALAGTEVILTAGDKPLARLVPMETPRSSRTPGLHPGSIWMSDDFDDPLPDEFWLGEE